jgi:peptidoglycan-associated lipoprotein
MDGTFSWKRVALALFLAAVVAMGCSKKQTVKSDGAGGAASGTAAAAPAGSGAGEVKEGPVKDSKAGAAAETPVMTAKAAEAAAGVAVTEEKASRFADVRFDFDKAILLDDGKKTSQEVAGFMKKNPQTKVLIEGHCDERGTAEYNLALGERRAAAVKTYLASLGVSKGALSTVSFGKERPLDSGHSEDAWAKNRRAHFVLK